MKRYTLFWIFVSAYAMYFHEYNLLCEFKRSYLISLIIQFGCLIYWLNFYCHNYIKKS